MKESGAFFVVRSIFTKDIIFEMTEKNVKFLKKLKKYRSEADDEGVGSDLKMLRTIQRFLVGFIVINLVQVAPFLRMESLSFHLWVSALFFLLAVFFVWNWWQFESCRSELEDELLLLLREGEDSA